MINVLIFGGNSDIAISVANLLDPTTFKVTKIGRTDFNLARTDISTDLDVVLQQYKPDVIINCAGVLGNLDTKFDQIFNTNVRCNWEIIHYYLKNKPDKTLKFIMLGSSVYKQGRRNMILYAASKAALYNMWQGASELCEDKNIVLGLINPVRVNTKMVKHLTHSNPKACLEAIDVAKEVIKLINTMDHSVSIDLDYKDIK